MVTATKQYNIIRPERPKTLIETPHLDGTLTFVYEKLGPGTYAKVAESIDNTNLSRPTMAETASLVHQASLNEGEPEFREIKDLMKNRWILGFTGTLYTKEGAYIQDNPEIRGNMPFMEESELVKRLEDNDESVRFVPFGYKTESMSSLELAKNPYVIALAGEEGAEKLAEIADKHRNKPYLWSFEEVDEPLTRVSALGSGWGIVDHGLGVGGYGRGDWDGYAFGVQKTGEASRTEK